MQSYYDQWRPDSMRLPIGNSNNDAWSSSSSYTTYIGVLAPIIGFLSQSYLFDSIKLLVLGSLIETGRRTGQWLIERLRFRMYMTATFREGDPAYEWILNFLTEENVWKNSCDFEVTAKSSTRKWGIASPEGDRSKNKQEEDDVELEPTWSVPQVFRWNKYWVEVKKDQFQQQQIPVGPGSPTSRNSITLTVYSLRVIVLSQLIKEARLRYMEVRKPHVIVHLSDTAGHGPGMFIWNTVKRKARRPISSVVLEDGVMEGLLDDAQDFLNTEAWYQESGIPHRRGYLLYGPPGTGKTSTIYSLAGELGLEIYSLSLSSNFIDDNMLQNAASSTPKKSILLIEDIDCAFPSREDEEEQDVLSQMNYPPPPVFLQNHKSAVTMSGLLNVLDGVGSDEGKIFVATTNYIDRLDPALLRPGRIDKRLEYTLASRHQAQTLFSRFFSEKRFGHLFPSKVGTHAGNLSEKRENPLPGLQDLALTFASGVPEREFTTAELQGYLLGHKRDPVAASKHISEWVLHERKDKKEREERERIRKEKAKSEMRAKRDAYGPPGYGANGLYGPAGMMRANMGPNISPFPPVMSTPLTLEENSPLPAVVPSLAPSVDTQEDSTSSSEHA